VDCFAGVQMVVVSGVVHPSSWMGADTKAVPPGTPDVVCFVHARCRAPFERHELGWVVGRVDWAGPILPCDTDTDSEDAALTTTKTTAS